MSLHQSDPPPEVLNRQNKAKAELYRDMRTPAYSFCETVHAGAATPWHIRELTAIGRKLGGGADTLALCGTKVSWDVTAPVDGPALASACTRCIEIYRKEIGK